MHTRSKKYLVNLVYSILCSSFIVVHAQDGLEGTDPAEPIINDCLESKEGQQECATRPPDIEAKGLVCSVENYGLATFSLCNHEEVPVTAVSIDSSSQNYIEQRQPQLPLTIEPEMCIEITVVGVERKDTIEDCNPESMYCLRAHENKKPGFDCSGNYGLGYDFISDSKIIEGLSGFVSLYNPRMRDLMMKNKTRRIFLQGIWTTPIIHAVTLPAHAEGSCCTFQDLDVTISNVACDSMSTPNIGSFTLCNNESSPLTIEDAGVVSSSGSIIDSGQCSEISVNLDSCSSGTEISFRAYLYDELVFGDIVITVP